LAHKDFAAGKVLLKFFILLQRIKIFTGDTSTHLHFSKNYLGFGIGGKIKILIKAEYLIINYQFSIN
jgi:hypothetical protein